MKLTSTAQTFNLGDTSFRRKTLIDDYKVILPFLQETNLEFPEWDNESQAYLYEKVLKESGIFSRNETEDFAKRGRTMTSALVKLGLVNSKRKLSRVSLNWLRNTTTDADLIEKSLGLDKTNLLFTRQLLKLRVYNYNGDSFFYPFRVGLELVKRYRNIPQLDFLTIIHLISPQDSQSFIEEIISGYDKVVCNQQLFPEFINQYFPEISSSISVDDFFVTKPLNRSKFDELFVNRKSSSTQDIYFDFVQKLLRFKEQQNEKNLKSLISMSRNPAIKKAFGFGKTVFIQSTNLEDFLKANDDNPLLLANHSQIYHQFVLSKKDDIVKEYRDMTRRTFNLSGLFDFSNGLVNAIHQDLFNIIFNELSLSGVEKITDYEEDLGYSFYQELTITEILDVKQGKIVSDIKKLFNIDQLSELESAVVIQKEYRFRKFIEENFPRDRIIELLPLFSVREDDKLKSAVSEAATVPTIFEYIIAIAWYYISSQEFYITKSLNLTLDGNMRPLSHATGGAGDIVIHYPDLVLMLEVTLMNSQAQKRGEWEPVLRHATNLTVEKSPKNVTTLFIADEFDDNTVNIWRAVASVPLRSSKTGELAELVKIFPLQNNEILEMLLNNKNEIALLKAIDTSYQEMSGNFNLGWRDNILVEAEFN